MRPNPLMATRTDIAGSLLRGGGVPGGSPSPSGYDRAVMP